MDVVALAGALCAGVLAAVCGGQRSRGDGTIVEDLVSLGDCLELDFGCGALGLGDLVGVGAEGGLGRVLGFGGRSGGKREAHLVEGFLDLGFGGRLVEAEDLVEVHCGGCTKLSSLALGGSGGVAGEGGNVLLGD